MHGYHLIFTYLPAAHPGPYAPQLLTHIKLECKIPQATFSNRPAHCTEPYDSGSLISPVIVTRSFSSPFVYPFTLRKCLPSQVQLQKGLRHAFTIRLAAKKLLDVEPDKERWCRIARDWYAQGIADTLSTSNSHHHLGLFSREKDGKEMRAVCHFVKRCVIISYLIILVVILILPSLV